MRFLWFGNAKDSVKEASSDATQIERLFNDSRRAAHDMESHLQHILHTIPPNMRTDEFRKLEGHLQVMKSHAEHMRQHVVRLDEHVRVMDAHLQKMKTVQHQKAA